MTTLSRLYAALPRVAQDLACTLAGAQRRRLRYGEAFDRHLAALEATRSASREALHRLQTERLAHLLRHARETSSWYRERLDDPDRLGPWEALAGLSPLTKEQLHTSNEALRSRTHPASRTVRYDTSGSTGTPLRILHDRETVAQAYACVWRGRMRAGASLHDPSLSFCGHLVVPVATNHPPFFRTNHGSLARWLRDRAGARRETEAGPRGVGRQTLFSAYHLSKANFASYVEAVHTEPARFVQGYPSALAQVAAALLEAGRPLPRGRIVAVFTSSETLLAPERAVIEAGFQAPVRDYYSGAELAWSMGECEAGRLHVDHEFGIVELEEVDERGEGYERGPILATGLATFATPLLRYRTGDLGTRATTACPCGRAGDTFLSIDGRLEDVVVSPSGRRIGRLDHVFKGLEGVALAQIVQTDATHVLVRVVPRETFDLRAESRLRAALRERLGAEFVVEVQRVDAIAPQPNGKLRAVVGLGRGSA